MQPSSRKPSGSKKSLKRRLFQIIWVLFACGLLFSRAGSRFARVTAAAGTSAAHAQQTDHNSADHNSADQNSADQNRANQNRADKTVTTAPHSDAPEQNSSKTEQKRIVFLGDSLTEGFGVDPQYNFPSQIADKIRAEGLPYSVINAGISGDTSAGGLQRVDWLLRAPVDIVFLALGANDALRGLDLKQTEQNLLEIIAHIRKQRPNAQIILAGMLAPPNLGKDYTDQFRDLYPRIARQENLELLPFLLNGVAGDYRLNQADGIHPTADGYKIVTESVWSVLRKHLSKSLR